MNFSADREFKILMTKSGKNDKKLTKNDKTWEKVQVNQQQQQLINF